MQTTRTAFDDTEIKAFRPEEKIGILATVTPDGLPHLSLITSLQAAGPSVMTLGQFCKGNSKQQIQQTRKAGFLIMTRDRRLWRGKVRWTHLKKEGPEFEAYNNLPMFRYNAYFGINTVHFFDLVETSMPETLPIVRFLAATLITRWARGGLKTKNHETILTPFALDLLNRFTALKFLSWVPDHGFPVIVPVLQCQAPDSRRIIFSSLAYKKELKEIPAGVTVAVYGLTMTMENVLIRGKFAGFRPWGFAGMGCVDIDWVYNSMPPCHGQIYPEVPMAPIVNF